MRIPGQSLDAVFDTDDCEYNSLSLFWRIGKWQMIPLMGDLGGVPALLPLLGWPKKGGGWKSLIGTLMLWPDYVQVRITLIKKPASEGGRLGNVR